MNYKWQKQTRVDDSDISCSFLTVNDAQIRFESARPDDFSPAAAINPNLAWRKKIEIPSALSQFVSTHRTESIEIFSVYLQSQLDCAIF